MSAPLDKVIATLILTALLGVTGLALFIWMGATRWEDTTGVIIGIIFVASSIIQGLFTLGWWRLVVRKSSETCEPGMKEMEDLALRKEIEANKL